MMAEDKDNVIPESELARRRRVNELVDDIHDLQRDSLDRIFELHELSVTSSEISSMLASRLPEKIQGALRDNLGFVLVVELAIGMRLFDGDAMKAVHRMLEHGDQLGIPRGVVSAVLNAVRGDAADHTHTDPIATATYAGVYAAIQERESRRLVPTISFPGGIDPQPDDTIPEVDSFAAARMRRTLDRLFAEAPKLETPGKPGEAQAPAVQAHVVLRCGVSMFGALSQTPEGLLRLLSPNEKDGKKVMIEHFFDIGDVCDVALVREVSMSSLFRS